MFGARFDDAIEQRSFVATDPVTEIVANDLSEVRDAIEQVSSAARDGYWVAGYVAYNAAPAFDVSLVVADTTDAPLVWFGVFGGIVDVDPPRVDEMASGPLTVSGWQPSISQDEYLDAFEAVRSHIEQGDTYQLNLTFSMRASVSGDMSEMYARLVSAQHPSYAAYLWHGDRHVISVSPEKFFAISKRHITTKPMKGTARRGRWGTEDAALMAALASSEKDRTENVMIVDLVRNDLGQICEYGSVTVSNLFDIEQFPTVWQMTSDVSGTVRSGIGLDDVFGALFPCGSVTGAPKARSMEIISRIEKENRGVYCGAIGFVPPGDGVDGASFNVAIRTVVVDEVEGMASYGVGGAITWSSTAADEYAEALTKARVLTEVHRRIGLFESIRWDGEFFMLDAHMDRLSESSEFLGMPCDVRAIRDMLSDVASTLSEPTKLRVDLSESGVVSVSPSGTTKRFNLGPVPSGDEIRIVIDREPLDSSDGRVFHKGADREHFDLRRRRNPDADDVLCVNTDGRVTESTVANVVFLIDGTWITPPVADGLLPGVLRQRLLEDGTLSERSVTIAQAESASAVALINSVRGWVPAAIIESPHK